MEGGRPCEAFWVMCVGTSGLVGESESGYLEQRRRVEGEWVDDGVLYSNNSEVLFSSGYTALVVCCSPNAIIASRYPLTRHFELMS